MENITGVEETVETNLPQEAAAEDDVVELSDLSVEEPEEQGEEKVEAQVEDAQPAQTGDDSLLSQDEVRNQERINAAIAQRLNAERRKFENDPIYQLGKRYAAQFESAEAAREQLLNEQAERLAGDPKAFAMEFLKQGQKEQPTAPAPETEDPRESVAAIVNDLIAMGDNGELPQDFNLDAYLKAYPDFINDYQQFGIKAAVKMAGLAVQNQKAAETSAKLEQNARLPQSTRPASIPREQPPDFQNMSSAQFRRYEEKIRRATMDGKRVKF